MAVGLDARHQIPLPRLAHVLDHVFAHVEAVEQDPHRPAVRRGEPIEHLPGEGEFAGERVLLGLAGGFGPIQAEVPGDLDVAAAHKDGDLAVPPAHLAVAHGAAGTAALVRVVRKVPEELPRR